MSATVLVPADPDRAFAGKRVDAVMHFCGVASRGRHSWGLPGQDSNIYVTILPRPGGVEGFEGFEAYNLGNERGFPVREVIEVARSIAGVPIRHQVVEARPGDPAALVADAARQAGAGLAAAACVARGDRRIGVEMVPGARRRVGVMPKTALMRL